MKKILSLTIVLVMLITLLPTAGMVSVSAANGVDLLSIKGTEELYSEYDYSDSNFISDEDFFGKWDAPTETWVKESYFNYEKYPELSEVEEAVKNDDYESAKELITEYYRNKFLNQPREIETTGDTSSVIAAKLACYNMYGATSFTNLDIIELPSDERWVSADVTSITQSATTSTAGKQYTFQIAAVKNDGIRGYVYSRESENAPYVKATVNGVEKTFPVVADTYIRGGSYASINYGTSARELYIEEAPDFSKADISFPYTTDTYTNVYFSDVMRARLTVDFSGLKSTDTVTDARLYVNGKADSEKLVVVQYKADLYGKETDDSWSWYNSYRHYMCYDGIAAIAGVKGDNSAQLSRYDQGNYELVELLSGVYRYTNDETYAYHAFRFFNAHAKAWGHKVNYASNYQGNLFLGTRSSSIPVQLAKLATSEHFTSENVVPLLKYAWLCGDGLVNCWDNQAENNNWGTYQTAGLASLVVNFKEFRVVDDPIEDGGYGNGKQGGWKALVNHRYYVVSNNVIRSDNSFSETMDYGKQTLYNFLKYSQYAEEAGEVAEIEAPLRENIRKLATYLLNVAGPDFCSTQYGDSIHYNYRYIQMAKDAAKATGDPFLIWAASGKKEGVAPDYTSVFYPINRKAALKTGWDTDDLYVDFAADNTVMIHNHADDLNIGMFCYGEPLLIDSMQYSYGTNDPKRNAVYATNNHNTLSIKVINPDTGMRENLSHIQNIFGLYTGPYPVYSEYIDKQDWPNCFFNRTREAEPGTVHRSELNNGYDYVEMSHTNYENWYVDKTGCDYAKANVNMKRSLLMLRDQKYMIVTDYVTALDDSDYIVAQNWHFMPGSNFTIDQTTGIAKTDKSGANVQIIPIKAESSLDYVYEREGYYCPNKGVIQNNPYPAYEKSGAGDKVYNTVILPTSPGQSVTSTAQNIALDVGETTASASHITMTDDNTGDVRDVYYYILHDAEKKEQRTFGKYSTDSKLALVEHYNGMPSMYIIQDGTNITDSETGTVLLASASRIEELSVTINGDVMELDSSKELDLATLAIRSDEKIRTVKLNGENIDFYYMGSYVYFGEEPEFTDKTIDFSDEDNIAYGKKVTSNAGRYWQSSKPSSSKQYVTDGDMTTAHKGNGKDSSGNATGVSFTLDLEKLYKVTEFALYIPAEQSGRSINIYSGAEVNENNLITTVTAPDKTKPVNGVSVFELRSDIDDVKASQITVEYIGEYDFSYIELFVRGDEIVTETIDFASAENISYGKTITEKEGTGFTLDFGEYYYPTEFAIYMPVTQTGKEVKIYRGEDTNYETLIATIKTPQTTKIINGVEVYELKASVSSGLTNKITVVYNGDTDFEYTELYVKGREITKEIIDFTIPENLAYGKKIKHIGGHYYNSSTPSTTKQYATDGDVSTKHSGYGVVNNKKVGVTFSIDLGKEYDIGKVTMFLSQENRNYKVYKGTSVDEANLLATATSEGERIKVNGCDTVLEKVSATFDKGVKTQYLTFHYPNGYGFYYYEIYISGPETTDGGEEPVVPDEPEEPEPIVPIAKLKFTTTKFTAYTGSKLNLMEKLAATPTDYNDDIVWTSSNESVCTVDENGVVTAVSKGTAKITATAVNGRKKATCTVKVNRMPEGIIIEGNTTVPVGKSVTLKAYAYYTENGKVVKTKDAISWESYDENIATVSKGKVKGMSAGETTVGAYIEDLNIGTTVTVNVVVPVKSLKLASSKVTAYEGYTVDLGTGLTVSPLEHTDEIVWTSSNENVCTVDENGIVTAVSKGKAKITATALGGGKKAICTVTVNRMPEGIIIEGSSAVAIGKNITLKAYAYYTENGKVVKTKDAISWESYDETIATVSKGKVTGKTADTTTIRAYIVGTDIEATVDVNVVIPAKSVKLSMKKYQMGIGEVANLSEYLTVSPENHTDIISWKSSKETVATVDENGRVTAIEKGTAKITVTAEGGKKSASITITVK